MDKRELARRFRGRLRQVVDAHEQGRGHFMRAVGIDRSALSQFLATDSDRMPRAETLHRMAKASGVSADWLLCLENAPEGRQDVTDSLRIEQETQADGSTPLDRWRTEAAGQKLRTVPSGLPDIISLASTAAAAPDAPRGSSGENLLRRFSLEDMDIEVAMPFQTLQDLALRSGLWRDAARENCRTQLRDMARVCREHYPALRLHVYDGRDSFSAPFTVFGQQRVALYVGEAYLVISNPEQVRGFSRRFDRLVRHATIGSDRVHETLTALADQV